MLLLLALCLAAAMAVAAQPIGNLRVVQHEDQLIVPSEELIDFTSSKGRALFSQMMAPTPSPLLLPMVANLETQMNLGACAAASACTVLNTLEHAMPYDPTYTMFNLGTDGYAHWTQDAFIFHECTKQVLGSHVFGITLRDFGRVMQCLGLEVDCQYGNSTAKQLSASLRHHLAPHEDGDDHVVVANFQRSLLHQTPGGHFSPLGNGRVKDRDGHILVLDVARYKYYPVFALEQDLLRAMMTFDAQSGTTRGFCALWKKK